MLDYTNRVLLENNPQPVEVIKSSTAYTMSELLYGVVNGSSGTGKQAKLSNIPTYGKTGTTNNNYDKWFVGYTKHYVGGVWFGFDQQKSISDAGISGNISVRLWKKVMEKIHDGLSAEKIEAGEDTVQVSVCVKTGNLASNRCNATTEYFTRGEEPKIYCDGNHGTKHVFEEEKTEGAGFNEDGTPADESDYISIPTETSPEPQPENTIADDAEEATPTPYRRPSAN